MKQQIKWSDLDKAPRDGRPFWIGTASGGVLLEAWHWCAEKSDFAGVYSQTTLSYMKSLAPTERFYHADMVSPKRPRQGV